MLVTFAIFAIFADISGSFLASFFSKSWLSLDLLFLRFLRYLLVILGQIFSELFLLICDNCEKHLPANFC